MLVLTSLLLGCSPKNNAPTDVTKDGKVQIMVWYSGGKTAAGVFEAIIQEFNQSQSEFQVTGLTLADYDETYSKLQAAIAGKTAADIVLLDADKSSNLASKHLLADLSPFIQQDTEFQTEDYVDVFFQQGVSSDHTIFALPAYGTTQIMYYNKNLFEKSDLNPMEIETWQDLANAAQSITVRENEKTTCYGWEPMWGADNLIDAALSNSGSLLSADGKQVLIDSPQWVEVWDSIRTWIHEDNIMRIHFGGQGWEYWYATMDDVLNDTAGGYTGSSGDMADLDFELVGAMEQPGWGNHPAAPVARALQLVMVASEKERTKEGAYQFMKFFSSPESQANWSMATGYVPVRKSTLNVASYQEYIQKNPQAAVPLSQALHSQPRPIDPTGGKIYDALDIAADKIEIENIPAKDALTEACQVAQKALDDWYAKP